VRRIGLFAALAAAVLAVTVAPGASASRFLKIGIYDEAQTLYGPVPESFSQLGALHVQVVRLNLYWGGRYGVARERPKKPTDPADPAYDWRLYDRAVNYAAQYKIRIVFSIFGTPSWANGGQGTNAAPTKPDDLRKFAYAAATRYSGRYQAEAGKVLPPVRYWLAWNEPNNPIFLAPQYKRVASHWVLQGAADYAKICNAIYSGVHATVMKGELVGCGVTAPRGNNTPTGNRPSVSPLAFLRAVKAAGLRTFDAWAHHPYYGSPSETPTTRPGSEGAAAPTAVTLGNINTLIHELTTLYGKKRVWLTEYGYQTNPPDQIYGVSYAKQARYLKEAFAIARRNSRIDMMLWFLLKDESTPAGWQSGLLTNAGQKKPAWNVFRHLRG
jgi:Glycosyl hydrolase catalytic core